jgi:hypothetical protein
MYLRTLEYEFQDLFFLQASISWYKGDSYIVKTEHLHL